MNTFPLKDSPMWSLGVFTPKIPVRDSYSNEINVSTAFRKWLGGRLTDLTDGHGWPISVHVRSPWHMWSLHADPTNQQSWHHDGQVRTHMVVWSNNASTEIKVKPAYKDRQVYQAAPGEVLIIDNKALVHRPPVGLTRTEKAHRWFIRCTTGVPSEIKDVRGVYALELVKP